MATLDRRPVDVQLLEAGTERHKDLRMVTHDFRGGSPLDEGLMKDLDHPAEILPLGASRSHNGPAVGIEDENTMGSEYEWNGKLGSFGSRALRRRGETDVVARLNLHQLLRLNADRHDSRTIDTDVFPPVGRQMGSDSQG